MPVSSLVPPDRFEFGYNYHGVPQSRIIIKDKTDPSKVKIYDKESDTKYVCVGCQKVKLKNHAHFINSEVHEPGFHLKPGCKSISAVDCAAEQANIKERRIALRNVVPVENIECSPSAVVTVETTTSSLQQSSPKLTLANSDAHDSNNTGSCGMGTLEKENTRLSENIPESAYERSQDSLVDPKLLNDSHSELLANPREPSSSSSSISFSQPNHLSTASPVTQTKHTEYDKKVKYGDFMYGYGNNNKKRNKIFVFEDSRDFGRVYIFCAGEWYCNGCFMINNQRLCGYLKKGYFCPPSLHLCEPITRQEFDEDQQKIKDKYMKNFATPPTSSAAKVQMQSDQNIDNVENDTQNDYLNENATASEQPSSSATSHPIRIVDAFDHEYSFNEFAERKTRFTIYELDRKYVRQYKVNGSEIWYCISCTTAYIKKLDDKVEIWGHHQCDPILALEYKDADKLLYQQSIASKNSGKTVTFDLPKESSISTSTEELSTSEENMDSNLPSSSSAPSLRKLDFHEWMFKPNDGNQIIVYENIRKAYAREYKYSKDSNEVVCIRCLEANPPKSSIGKRDGDDFSLMVPSPEEHVCVAFRINDTCIGKEISKKNERKKRGRIDDKENGEPSSAVKKSKTTVTSEYELNVAESNESSETVQISADILVFPSNSGSSIPTTQNILASPLNFNIPVSNQGSSSVKFLHPGGTYLDQCCTKLKIPFSKDAITFWSRINIFRIKNDSVPRECHSVTEANDSAFRCFSIVFSGSEHNYLTMKDRLLPYVCTNIQSIGAKHGIDLSRPDTPLFHELVLGDVASKIHFEALVKLLGCRIGIFENDQWQKFGNWNDGTVKSCIVLLQKVGKSYGIVLSLND